MDGTGPRDPRVRSRAGPRDPGRVSLHAGAAGEHVPGEALDDAPVRRLLDGDRVEPSVPISSRARHRPACRWRSTSRRRSAWTPTILSPAARSARSASRSTRSRTWRRSSTRHPAREGLDLDDDQRSGGDPSRASCSSWPSAAGFRGSRSAARFRTTSSRSTRRAARTSFRRSRPLRLVTDVFEFCAQQRAAVEHDLDLRLPHPRGGIDGRPGSRVHARERDRIREARGRPRARGRPIRAAPLVLLQRAQRLSGGSREVPRRPEALGAPDGGALRREGPALARAPLPRADGRVDAHRPAAGEQRRARRLPGDGRGPRRMPVPPHELARRGARPPHRRVGEHRAAHPADPRARDGRGRQRRPARRIVRGRGPHPRDRAARARS